MNVLTSFWLDWRHVVTFRIQRCWSDPTPSKGHWPWGPAQNLNLPFRRALDRMIEYNKYYKEVLILSQGAEVVARPWQVRNRKEGKGPPSEQSEGSFGGTFNLLKHSYLTWLKCHMFYNIVLKNLDEICEILKEQDGESRFFVHFRPPIMVPHLRVAFKTFSHNTCTFKCLTNSKTICRSIRSLPETSLVCGGVYETVL